MNVMIENETSILESLRPSEQTNQEQIAHYRNKLQYEIDSWDLHHTIENKEHIVIIDARSIEAYKNEHIPTAINFPHRTITKESAQERLDFSIQYVTYCDGIGCNASTKSALKLAELGYKVKELIGGIDWWKRDLYPTENSLSNTEEPQITCGCNG